MSLLHSIHLNRLVWVFHSATLITKDLVPSPVWAETIHTLDIDGFGLRASDVGVLSIRQVVAFSVWMEKMNPPVHLR